MFADKLLMYAESEIKRLGLGDSTTNCHGIAAYHYDDYGIRLSDGTLNVVCRNKEDIDDELLAILEWYSEPGDFNDYRL